MCPVDGAVCDRKCGFKAHATLTRKNRCTKCGGGLAPLIDSLTLNWDNESFSCLACGLCTKIPQSGKTINTADRIRDFPVDPADANICDGCE